MGFKPAVKEKTKGRIAFYGPAGGGKTYTSLALGLALAGGDPAKLFLTDTEYGTAAIYADVFGAFNHDELPIFTADAYLNSLKEAEAASAPVLVVDSFSHAWEGAGGILDKQAELEVKNTGQGWNLVKPAEKKLWNGMLSANLHLIVTMRSRNEWKFEEVTKNGRTKTERKIIGTEPIQRKGTEYEFNIVCFLQPNRNDEGEPQGVKLTIEKTRYDELPLEASWVFAKDTPEAFDDFSQRVIAALSAGEPPEAATEESVKELHDLLIAEGKDAKRIKDVLEGERAKNEGVLPQRFIDRAIEQAQGRAAAKASGGDSGE